MMSPSFESPNLSVLSPGKLAADSFKNLDDVEDISSHESWFIEIRENMKMQLIFTMITGIILSRRKFYKQKKSDTIVVKLAN